MGHHSKASNSLMYRHERALCCGDKLQHAPAPREHALTLHVQLITTIFTGH